MEIRKQPVRAKSWQLSILQKMHEERARPSAVQRHQLATEIGLDEAWIKSWFRRQNKKMSRTPTGGSVLTRPAKLLLRQMKPDPSLPEDAIQSGASRILSPFSSYPVSFQGTSNIFPALDVLLALPNGRADEGHGYRVESARILAPIPHEILPYVDPNSLGYVPDSPKSTPHPSMGNALTQSALPWYTSTWLYSRDPLHDRYPDFSRFFFPTPNDTFHDTAVFLELPPTTVLPMIDSASSFFRIDSGYTIQTPDYIPATTGSSISLYVPVRASLAELFLTHARRQNRLQILHKTRHFLVIEARKNMKESSGKVHRETACWSSSPISVESLPKQTSSYLQLYLPSPFTMNLT